MAQIKTNNSYLSDKVALRVAHLPEKNPLYVLDCFAGDGKIWKAVERLTGRELRVLPIDTIDYGMFYLPGDNMSYLKSIDLDRYDVIDLDAYGIPYEQLKELFERNYHGVVFVTFIQSIFGTINHGLLKDIGFSNEQINKIPTLFGKRGWEYFIEWLGLHGVEKIWHRHHTRKHYIGFNCVGVCEDDSDTQREDKAANRV
jgi:hypothetical protein